MIGAFAAGPLADRHGRKTLLIASMLLFGCASLTSGLSTGPRSLTWLRFITGVGLGGGCRRQLPLLRNIVRRPPFVTGHAHVLRLHDRFRHWRLRRIARTSPVWMARAPGRRRRRAASSCAGARMGVTRVRAISRDERPLPGSREAGAESDCADRPLQRCDVRGCSRIDGVSSTAALPRRLLRRHAASVGVVLHEPPGRAPPDQPDADTDSAVRCIARARRTDGSDVPDRRHARCDRWSAG